MNSTERQAALHRYRFFGHLLDGIQAAAGSGFDLHIRPADPAIADSDPTIAARQINLEIEHAIALAPEQYMWSYYPLATTQGQAQTAGPQA